MFYRYSYLTRCSFYTLESAHSPFRAPLERCERCRRFRDIERRLLLMLFLVAVSSVSWK